MALSIAVRYEVLNVLEYSSARARMSVIVRGPDGGIQMFCKGADAKVRCLEDEQMSALSKASAWWPEFSRRQVFCHNPVRMLHELLCSCMIQIYGSHRWSASCDCACHRSWRWCAAPRTPSCFRPRRKTSTSSLST